MNLVINPAGVQPGPGCRPVILTAAGPIEKGQAGYLTRARQLELAQADTREHLGFPAGAAVGVAPQLFIALSAAARAGDMVIAALGGPVVLGLAAGLEWGELYCISPSAAGALCPLADVRAAHALLAVMGMGGTGQGGDVDSLCGSPWNFCTNA